MPFSKSKSSFFVVSLTLMGVAFGVDAYTPRDVVDGMLYLPLIILTIFVHEVSYTIIAGLIATVLTLVGYYISPVPEVAHESAFTNRLLAVISGWTIVALIYVYKRSQQQALFYKERLGALFGHAQEGIIIVSDDECITISNPKISDLFGYEEKDLSGRKFSLLLPSYTDSSDPDCTREPNLLEIDSYAGKELVFCAKRKNGTHFPARVQIWSIDFYGKKYFIFFIFDITEIMEQRLELAQAHNDTILYAEELKKANSVLEERVHARTTELRETVAELETLNALLKEEMKSREQAVRALKESQVLQETISEHFPNGILAVLDHNFCFEYARGQEIKINSEYTGNLNGRTFFPLNDQESGDATRALLTRAFEGEKVSFEYRQPGQDKFYLYTAVPLPDAHDEIRQILVVSQNITSQKIAEYEIRRLLQKERELNEMKSRFVTTASHEFRTPLASIISSASLISMYQTTEDEPKRKKHVVRITSNVTNLTEILNDFLSLGKIEEGKVANMCSEFDIVELCEDIREEMQGIAKSGQSISAHYNLDPQRVVLDKHLLRNVLVNLLSNAIKYSPEESPVSLEVHREDGRLALSVKDHGIGIPPEDQKHLTQTFYRGSNVASIKGTGMGLHIVKKYLEIMKGTLHFESELDKGSRFTVFFDN